MPEKMSGLMGGVAYQDAAPQANGRERTIDFSILEQIADGIVRTLGPHCEVVVHDITDIEHSIAFIAGDVTRRTTGGGPTDLLLEKLRNQEYDDLFNYRTFTDDGKTLRSSSLFLRDGNGQPMGVVCINVDVSAFAAFQRTLQQLMAVDEPPSPMSESFAEDVEETVRIMVAELTAEFGKPLNDLNRTERIRLIGRLDQKGAFQMKRAVPLVAAQLGVSRFTVYTYLQEARS